jgi:hypothetical protein
MHRISLVVSQIRLERAEVSGRPKTQGGREAAGRKDGVAVAGAELLGGGAELAHELGVGTPSGWLPEPTSTPAELENGGPAEPSRTAGEENGAYSATISTG